MIKQYIIITILLSLSCIFLLFKSDKHLYNNSHHLPHENYHSDANTTYTSFEDIIKSQKLLLRQELIDFMYSDDLSDDKLSLSNRKSPKRNIIVTTWRAGSTFLGEILNSMPGNFYHYEPLLDYGIQQIRGPPLSDSALLRIKELLLCKFENLSSYIEYGKKHIYLFTHNSRLWNHCGLRPYLCWNTTFLSDFCKLFPFQSMKLVRLRLKLLESLLEDKL